MVEERLMLTVTRPTQEQVARYLKSHEQTPFTYRPCGVTRGESVPHGFEGHLECGQERLCVSWNREDDTVHYELLAVSRPNHLLTRVGYPYARPVQVRFRRRSASAMSRFVGRARPTDSS